VLDKKTALSYTQKSTLYNYTGDKDKMKIASKDSNNIPLSVVETNVGHEDQVWLWAGTQGIQISREQAQILSPIIQRFAETGSIKPSQQDNVKS